MLNEIFQDRAGDAQFFPCPSTVQAGDPVLIGTLPGVAVDDYNAQNGGSTFRFAGVFELPVHAYSVISPATGSAVKPGNKLYVTGTLDATTNVTTGLVISKDSAGTLFGSFAGTDAIAQNTVANGWVKLKENA